MNILQAISVRHSVRQYLDKPIDPEKLSAIKTLVNEVNNVAALNFQIVINDPLAFNGGIAKYGKFKNAYNYIAIVAPKGHHGDELAGYYGEKIVLFLQTIGLNSCWVGLTYKTSKNRYHIRPGESLKCVIVFGYGATQGIWHPIKKIINQVAINKTQDVFPEWFVRGIKAALLAPTAVNQHKYEFILHNENFVEAKTKFSIIGYTHIDLGIVKYHFEVAAGKENFTWK